MGHGYDNRGDNRGSRGYDNRGNNDNRGNMGQRGGYDNRASYENDPRDNRGGFPPPQAQDRAPPPQGSQTDTSMAILKESQFAPDGDQPPASQESEQAAPTGTTAAPSGAR
jgi:hypothetical protein